MKKTLSLILFLMLGFLLASCSLCEPEQTIEGFAIHNEPIDTAAAEYSAQELDSFFVGDPTQNTESQRLENTLFLDDINQRFPIQYLRKIENADSFYIVYPVNDGGKYLVFLIQQVDLATGQKRLCYSDALYVNNLPTEEAFAVLNSGSTYEDVKAVAPCTQLIQTRSSSIESYSLLSSGSVMLCIYSRTEDQTLVLESMDVVSNTDALFPYAGMIPSDLAE